MIVVTDRSLCSRNFMDQLERILSGRPEMVILREKSTPEEDILPLAYECLMMCERYEVPLSLNTDPRIAEKLDICRVHLPLPVFRSADLSPFTLVGTSVHSAEEAVEAESLGADYIIAGHVFETACKPFEPRGLDFLRSVCGSVDIPVYAIGGITPENVGRVADTGASGACSMSGVVTADDPAELIRRLTAPFFRPDCVCRIGGSPSDQDPRFAVLQIFQEPFDGHRELVPVAHDEGDIPICRPIQRQNRYVVGNPA